MAVPNYKAIVQSTFDQGDFDLSTKDGCGYFTRVVAEKVHKLDPNFGELLKSSGRTHYIDRLGRRVAVDAILYLPTGQSIDIVGSSATPKAKPAWTIDQPRYGSKDWAMPAGVGDAPEPPAPPPPPAPDLSARVARLEEGLLEAVSRLKEMIEENRSGTITLLQQHENRLAENAEAITKLDQRLLNQETKKLTLTASGSTGRALGHAHPITITLEEKA